MSDLTQSEIDEILLEQLAHVEDLMRSSLRCIELMSKIVLLSQPEIKDTCKRPCSTPPSPAIFNPGVSFYPGDIDALFRETKKTSKS